MANAVNWFEIPSVNFDRAVKFYCDILNTQLPVQEVMGTRMAFFHAEKGVGGAIVKGEGYVPSEEGVLVYLNGGDDLNQVLNRVEKAGGKVLVPKTHITREIGYFGVFRDVEGNRVAIHSMK